MTLDVLLSAMYLSDYKYIETLNISGNCVIINQTTEEKYEEIIRGNQRIKYICTLERGLSRSRNMAIKNSDSSVCVLCDNDIEYVPSYEKIILHEFDIHPEADIICFHINRENQKNPIYNSSKRMKRKDIGKMTSAQIAFRRENIQDIPFNILLGAGAKYSMGEESVFLNECLKARKTIIYAPLTIANVRDEESTWFKGFTDKYFRDRGACICVTSGDNSFLILTKTVGFAFKIKLLKDRNISIIRAIKMMNKGVREYLEDVRKG